MEKSQIASMLNDESLVRELQTKLGSEMGLPKLRTWGASGEAARSLVGGEEAPPQPEAAESRPLTEAVILDFGRPSLLVKNDTFETPDADIWKMRLLHAQPMVERAIRSVGRVELQDHDTYPWAGTAWMIAEDIAVTNRHVALIFAEKQGNTFPFIRNMAGKPVRASLDFKEEYRQNASIEREVGEVIFIEEALSDHPDMAFLRLKTSATLPPPIPLGEQKREVGRLVAAIGYPARDDRHDDRVLTSVFGDVYNVKRLAPGTVTAFDDSFALSHDCSTLTGSSGSVLIDLETGEAIGLHFGGRPRQANYAVKAATLLQALRRLKIKTFVTGYPGSGQGTQPAVQPPAGLVPPLEAPRPSDYADREGYLDDFLGRGDKFRVPLPTLGEEIAEDAVKVNGDGGESGIELRYTHFSVVMNRERNMAFFTATNIDGTQLRRVPRGDRWLYDPRIRKSDQVGEEVYSHRELDRGHLVRRLDPVWGSEEEAKQANNDTFHFTNACPQHHKFNSGIWNDLEDYVLDNAGAHKLKLLVFTGPVFRPDDQPFREIRIPSQFWKVVVMVRASDRKLSATAYMQSQADLISDLEAPFVTLGEFRTYQVPVARVEKLTKLDFGKLRDFDPLAGEESATFREVTGPQDLRF